MKQLLAELFERHYKDIYAYLFSLCRDASLSEDLASEVFLEAVKSVATFRGESDIKTWLFSIAWRRWFAFLKMKKQQLPTESIHELYDLAAPEAHSEASQLIQDILSPEPALTRDVVRMRMDGYAYYEIAARLSISESSARVIYFRAKSKIKKQLEKEGFHYG